MCIMLMKKAIPEAFRGLMSEKATTAKEFPVEFEQRFVITIMVMNKGLCQEGKC